ncbi:MAG TPA: MFS transporter [Solirubrobacteraceae bacterium]|nr:MFS transporter [Solirubrobacteraceae bacterium]
MSAPSPGFGAPPPRAPDPSAAEAPSGAAASAGVFMAALFAFLATGAALPVLPTYVHGPLHSGDVAVGIVVGSFAVTSVICRPIAGRLADGRGRRAVLVAGSLALALGGLLYILASSVITLVLARLMVGAGEGAVYTAGATWAVDLAPVRRRGLALGLFGLAVWGGLSLGPVMGELLRSAAGYDAVWILTAALPLAGAAIALRLPETARPERSERPLPLLIFPRSARRPGVALALANIGYAALAGFVVLDLRAQGIDGGATVFTAFAVSVFASRLIFSRVPDRAGARPTATAAGLIEALGLVVIAFAHSLPVALIGAVIVGSGFSMMFPSLALMVVGEVDDEHRGSAMGTFTAFFDFGVGLGGPLSGAMASLAGYPAVFFLAAAAALGTAGLAATAPHRSAKAC